MLARVLATLFVLALIGPVAAYAEESDRNDAFWEAARTGELATVKRLHEDGFDVNELTPYGATALSFACDKGHLDVVRYLVENGADVNVTDTFYGFNPLGQALFGEHDEIVKLLLEKGAEGADSVLTTAAGRGNQELVAAALATGQIDADDVVHALEKAATLDDPEKIVAMLQSAEVKPGELTAIELDPAKLAGFAGKFKSDEVGMTIEVRVEDGALVAQAEGQQPLKLRPIAETRFEAVDAPQIKMGFEGRGGITERLIVEQGGQAMSFPKMIETAGSGTAPDSTEPAPAVETGEAAARKPPQNWPSFRGPAASGVGDGQGAPLAWNVESGENVRWKTPIPGMANSSPVTWGDRVYLTTAISSGGDDTFRTGLYGDVDSVDDESEHEFRVYGLERASGKILWERTVATAVPGAKRHMKSTQANSTPVTDGKRVVALFGTIGLLIAFDPWTARSCGGPTSAILDAGWFYDRTYQWGHASSPVIHDDLVIVQADIYAGSFIAAYRLADGKQAWKSSREDVPSWGSPTIFSGGGRDELIANGKTIKGYDPVTGKELWSLAPNSEVTVATPIIAHDLIYVTAGYPPVRPIYAIRPGGKGDLTLPDEAESSETIAWSKSRGGTYMPTPIVYGDYLYTCANDGRLTCYEAKSGELVYRARIGGGGRSFTASPVAADGRLYFTEETGEIHVVKAGPVYEELATNEMGEVCMSTPAITDGLMIVRTLHHLFGLGEPEVTP